MPACGQNAGDHACDGPQQINPAASQSFQPTILSLLEWCRYCTGCPRRPPHPTQPRQRQIDCMGRQIPPPGRLPEGHESDAQRPQDSNPIATRRSGATGPAGPLLPRYRLRRALPQMAAAPLPARAHLAARIGGTSRIQTLRPVLRRSRAQAVLRLSGEWLFGCPSAGLVSLCSATLAQPLATQARACPAEHGWRLQRHPQIDPLRDPARQVFFLVRLGRAHCVDRRQESVPDWRPISGALHPPPHDGRCEKRQVLVRKGLGRQSPQVCRSSIDDPALPAGEGSIPQPAHRRPHRDPRARRPQTRCCHSRDA